MKKLDEIPKKHPFEVPEGYFDKLPGIIQARIERGSNVKETTPYFRYAFQYALPVLILTVIAVLYLVPQKTQNVDNLLASVSTEELIAYLEQSDLTTEELLESMELNNESVEAIETEVYFNLDELEDLEEIVIDAENF